jgi:signal transduction histidine kinase
VGIASRAGRWKTATMARATSAEVAGEGRLLTVLLDIAAGRDAHSELARHAAHAVGSEAAAVMRYLGRERAVVVGEWRVDGVRGMPVNAELDFDSSNSAIGRARSTGAPARADSYAGRRGELPLVMEAIGLRSAVAAPITLESGIWGAIAVSTTREEPLPPESEQLIGDLAVLAGRAVAAGEDRRRLAASRLRVVEGADEARRRLERQLHEGPHQHLLALSLKLRVARSQAADGSALAGLLDDAVDGAMDVDAALRDLARELYPLILTERGLAAAVQALAVRVGVPVTLRRLPSRRFPPVIEATAYFVIAEALAAAASEAALLVSDAADRLTVEVSHDGATSAADPYGTADRVAAAGGFLDVVSQPGAGTELRLELPLTS